MALNRAAPGLAKVSYLPGHAPSIEPTGSTIDDESGGDGHDLDGRAVDSLGSEEHDAEVQRAKDSRAEEKRARKAENVSMAALTRRGQSRHELEKTLLSRELEPDEVEAELERLEGVGLIDDAALAETIVRTQHERKGLGRGALIAELRRRHIDQEHIDSAMEQIDGDDELARARELAERRAPQLRSLDRTTAVRRLTAYLMRKGYGSSVVRAAVDAALSGGSGDDSRGSSGGVRFR